MRPCSTAAALSLALDRALWRAADVDSSAAEEVDATGVLQALKAGDAAAAVTEFETVRLRVERGTLPPLSAELEATLEAKLGEARNAAKGEYRI